MLHYSANSILTNVHSKDPVIIVGTGPAGLFAALRLIEKGLKPILIERGKDVRARRRDLVSITREHKVNEDSNYCFGEGGAGTYSDGKLYTRSKKRGDIRRILELLVYHGAKEAILADSHPHIGTNKLPGVIQRIRETILDHGGEIHFNTRMEDILVKGNVCNAVRTNRGDIEGKALVLATGHSARDVYHLFDQKGWKLEAKPFALGLRVEHPQALIDEIQYNTPDRGSYLPAASYSIVHQTQYADHKRGVFSFCMCPGGFIVPSATANGEIVVNGMSPSKRNSPFANSGIVCSIEIEDIQRMQGEGVLAGLELQAHFEQLACELAGGTQKAPAQRLTDFMLKRESDSLVKSSYVPGLSSVNLHEVLGKEIGQRLRQAFQVWGEKMNGFMTEEAQLLGVESRTSAPVRIPRDAESFLHPDFANLYPCGEGGGYAGGIVSAAMDGERVADSLASRLNL